MACRTTLSISACRAAAQSRSAGLSAAAFCGNVGIGVSPLGAPRQGRHGCAPTLREDTPLPFFYNSRDAAQSALTGSSLLCCQRSHLFTCWLVQRRQLASPRVVAVQRTVGLLGQDLPAGTVHRRLDV